MSNMINDNHSRQGYACINHIRNIIINQHPIVYCAVGGSMANYVWPNNMNIESINTGYTRMITDTNNQQDPIFLRKFEEHKLIVIIDPDVEVNPKVSRNIPLQQTLVMNGFRIYSNANYTVITIKEYLDYHYTDSPHYMEDFHFIGSIIETCMQTNSKMILQDLTGRDITNLYCRYMEYFGNNILSNILFDATYGTGDCLPEFTEDMASIDMNDNFIQPRFQTLVSLNLSNSNSFHEILKDRIKFIINEVSWQYNNYINGKNHNNMMSDRINYFCTLYSIVMNDNDKWHMIGRLIETMIHDIALSRGCNNEVGSHLFSIINDRSNFIKSFSVLSFD
jgi:hypothetical protein